MSSNRNKPALPLLFRRTAPFLAMICLLCGAAFCVVIYTLGHSEEDKAGQLLNHYQEVYLQSGPAGLQLAYTGAGRDNSSFLRLEGENLRLILITDTPHGSSTVMPDFSSFSRSGNLVWHALQHGRTRGPWTVAAARLPDGAFLQIGIDSGESLLLVQRLGKRFLQLLFLFLPLCFLAGWLTIRRSRESIQALIDQFRAITENTTREFADITLDAPGSRDLMNTVNQLLFRHRRLSRELHEAMDNVAHDLRTPITRLRATAEYGLRKSDDTAHLREALEECLEESDHLLSMLNTMLKVAEAEADTVTLDLQPVALEDSINDALDLYAILAEDRGIAIQFTPRPDLVVLADRQRISQVWANLLDNAIKYNGTQIVVSTEKVDSMAEIRIQDNGMGISENELDSIWTRLFRGDRSRSKPGLGLGLTLVKAVVGNHHGTIDVKSVLNRGTTFIIRLPLAGTKPCPDPAAT